MKKHPHKKLKIISYSALAASIIGISASLASCTISVTGGEPTQPEVKLPIFDHSNISTPITPNFNTKDQFTIRGENLDAMVSSKFNVKHGNQSVSYRIVSTTNSQLKIQILNFKPTIKSSKEYILSCYYDNQQVARLSYNYEDVELPPPPVETNPEFDPYHEISAESNNSKQFVLTGRNLQNINRNDLKIRSQWNNYINFTILYSNSSSIKISINDTFDASTDLDCYYKQARIATLKLVVQEPSFTNNQYNSDSDNRMKFTVSGSNLHLVKRNKLSIVDSKHTLVDFDITNQTQNQLTVRLNKELEGNQILTLKYDGNKVATLNYLAPEKLPIFTENQNATSDISDNKLFKLYGQNLTNVNKSLLVIKNKSNPINYELVSTSNSWVSIRLTDIPSTNASLDCYYNGHKFGTLSFVSWEPTFERVEIVEGVNYIISGSNFDRMDTSEFKVHDTEGRTLNSTITETSKNRMTLQLLQQPEESQTLACYYKGRKVLDLNYIAPEKVPTFNTNNLVESITGDNKSFNLTGQNLEKVVPSKFKVLNGQSDVAHSITNISSTQITVKLTNDLDQDATLTCYYDNQQAGTLVYKKPVVEPEPPKPEKPTETIPDWQKERPEYSPHLSSTLPRIDINVDNLDQLNSTKNYQKFNIKLTDENGKVDNGKDNTGITGQIKVRGNTTSTYNKKPYRLKFDKKQSMFGLNAFKDGTSAQSKNWVLLADWLDISMTRNAASLYLSQYLYREIGLYASDFRYVDVYMNNDYYGVYLLAEQNEVNDSRVNINKYDKNYTGTDIGYLIEMDAYAEYVPEEEKIQRFWMDYAGSQTMLDWDNKNPNTYFDGSTNWYAIKNDIYTEEQRVFIQKYLKAVYRICYEAIVNNKYYVLNDKKDDVVLDNNIKDPKDAIERVVNIDSVIATIILQEMVCDYDVSNSSFYMTADFSPRGDGKLHFTAPWDFDNALGNRNRKSTGVRYADKLYSVNTKNYWLALFYKYDFVRTGIKERWNELKNRNVFSEISNYIDTVSQKYKSKFADNYNKWKNIAPHIEERMDAKEPAFTAFYTMLPDASWKCTSQEQAAKYLKQWWDHRVKVLDSLWTRNLLSSSVVSVTANDNKCSITNNVDNRMTVRHKKGNISFKVELANKINQLYDEQTIKSLGFSSNANVSWTPAAETFFKVSGTETFKSNNNEKDSITFHGVITEQGKQTQYATLTLIFVEESTPSTIFNIVINSPKNKNEY